jgi:hypothetical protein
MTIAVVAFFMGVFAYKQRVRWWSLPTDDLDPILAQ